MTKRIVTILLSFLPLITQANNSALSIGVRGGGQTYLPTAAVGATGEVKPGIGGTGGLELRYTYYGSVGGQVELGFGIGAGFGYGAASLKGTNTDSYSNTDYLGNKMDYTVTSAFTQTDRFAKVDASLLFAMRFSGVTLNIGPRFMMPLSATRTLTIHEANIDAYYPAYDVHVVNQQITGKLDNSQFTMPNSQCAIPKYTLLMCAEIGYEWYFSAKSCLGFQLYADVGVWNKKDDGLPVTGYGTPLIQVSPITDATNPVPSVTVGSAEPFVSGRRYIGAGVRAYYAFHIEHIRIRQFKPRGDSRDHRNRYLWW